MNGDEDFPALGDADLSPERLLEMAQAQAGGGDGRGALRSLCELFRKDSRHAAGLALAAEVSRALDAEEEARLFEGVAAQPDDPQGLYDLGFRFVESGLPDVAVPFLQRCFERKPEHPLVAYELGYALFAAGKARRAAPLLEKVTEHDEVPDPEALAARMLLVRCHVATGDLEAARAAFDDLERACDEPDLAPQVDALAQLLARAERFARLTTLGPRERLFVDHGGVLLHVPRGRREEVLAATAGHEFLAGVLRRLESLLTGLDLVPAVVQYHGGAMLPLALAFAERIGATVEPFTTGVTRPTLVMVARPEAADPLLERLRRREEGVDLFSLSLDPERDHAIAPEVVGVLARALRLPWEDRLELHGETPRDATLTHVTADPRTAAEIAGELQQAIAADHDDEGDRRALGRFYVPLKDLLVLGNYDKFSMRRVYTARNGR